MQEGEGEELTSIDHNKTPAALNERGEAADTLNTTSTVIVKSGSPHVRLSSH